LFGGQIMNIAEGHNENLQDYCMFVRHEHTRIL
jgi:hypothetical protein